MKNFESFEQARNYFNEITKSLIKKFVAVFQTINNTYVVIITDIRQNIFSLSSQNNMRLMILSE